MVLWTTSHDFFRTWSFFGSARSRDRHSSTSMARLRPKMHRRWRRRVEQMVKTIRVSCYMIYIYMIYDIYIFILYFIIFWYIILYFILWYDIILYYYYYKLNYLSFSTLCFYICFSWLLLYIIIVYYYCISIVIIDNLDKNGDMVN